MNMKKLLLESIIIFILCSFCHFGYTIFPNFVTSIFFPVNESIFEHLKMLFTAEVIFSIGKIILDKKDKNKYLRMFLRGILSVFILLLLYLPIYYFLGEIMLLTFLILFTTIFLTEYILSFLSSKKSHLSLNIASIAGTILLFIILGYLTYHPIKEKLFFDEQHKKYGIDIIEK